MYRMHGAQYTSKDVTKYKYMISLLRPKSLVHTIYELCNTLTRNRSTTVPALDVRRRVRA